MDHAEGHGEEDEEVGRLGGVNAVDEDGEEARVLGGAEDP
jgi:hypothetical protein